jgi:hypothetical protein
MTRNIRIVLLYALAVMTVDAAYANTEHFYKAHLPTNVSIGMSAGDFGTVRPSARKNDLIAPSSGHQNAFDMVEIAQQGGNRVAYWYRFKEGVLEAVTQSMMTALLPLDQAEAAARQFEQDMSTSFQFKEHLNVLRRTGSQTSIISVQLWEDATRELNVYFLATNREITFVMFNPKQLGKNDFFVGSERQEDFDNKATVLGEQTKDAKRPTPLVDLLRKSSSASRLSSHASGSLVASPHEPLTKETEARSHGGLLMFGGLFSIIVIAALLVQRHLHHRRS